MKLAGNDYIRDSNNYYKDAGYPFRMLCSGYFNIRMNMMAEFDPGQQVKRILVRKIQLRLAQVGSLLTGLMTSRVEVRNLFLQVLSVERYG